MQNNLKYDEFISWKYEIWTRTGNTSWTFCKIQELYNWLKGSCDTLINIIFSVFTNENYGSILCKYVAILKVSVNFCTCIHIYILNGSQYSHLILACTTSPPSISHGWSCLCRYIWLLNFVIWYIHPDRVRRFTQKDPKEPKRTQKEPKRTQMDPKGTQKGPQKEPKRRSRWFQTNI